MFSRSSFSKRHIGFFRRVSPVKPSLVMQLVSAQNETGRGGFCHAPSTVKKDASQKAENELFDWRVHSFR